MIETIKRNKKEKTKLSNLPPQISKVTPEHHFAKQENFTKKTSHRQ